MGRKVYRRTEQDPSRWATSFLLETLERDRSFQEIRQMAQQRLPSPVQNERRAGSESATQHFLPKVPHSILPRRLRERSRTTRNDDYSPRKRCNRNHVRRRTRILQCSFSQAETKQKMEINFRCLATQCVSQYRVVQHGHCRSH